jgi:very-short-patch-repair endonuclease
VIEEPGPSNCERCGKVFHAEEIWGNMFGLQNVVTRRRQRINCDEEERLRLGYELKTGFRFAERDGRPLFRTAQLTVEKDRLAEILYGDAAEIWRINLGWSRRERKEERGFWLDVEQRRWSKRAVDPDNEEDGDDLPGKIQRVIPYVKDRRNSLLLTLAGDSDPKQIASLEAALKRGIQTEFQLEDSELATEPLPDRKNRRHLLFYEASEGGAGVLRQMVEDPASWERVARTALSLCHFDPESGSDLGKAEHAEENCQAACYDCLLSYYNQPDHPALDRHAVRDLLLKFRGASVVVSPVEMPRAAHLEQMKRLCDSGLEREFLDFLEAHTLRIPARAQHFYESYKTRPDFSYIGENPAFIYVDGPPHDYPDRHERDKEQTAMLQLQGLTVVRFHHKDNWLEVARKHPSIFGEVK